MNIPLHWAIWFGVTGFPLTWANLTGFGLCAILLAQGAAYWVVKRGQLRERRSLPRGMAVFAILRRINVAVLGAGVLATLAAVFTDPGDGSIPGLAFALFAVLEHVNYFHVQLMYDNRADLRRLRMSGLRRSHLAWDLRRYDRAPRGLPPSHRPADRPGR